MGGNNLSVIPLIPNMLDIANTVIFTIGLSCIVTIMLLAVAVMSFNRKQF